MRFTKTQYAKALGEALEGTAGNDHDKVIDRFVEVLKQNNDLPAFESIVEEYEKLAKANTGITEAEVTLAQEVKLGSEIIDSLNKAVGEKVELKVKVDKSIVGGIIVRAGDTLIDASVKKQLENLKANLIK